MALTKEDFQKVAAELKCEVAAIMAVQEVETGGRGGFNPDGSVATLFEGHWFSKLTNRKYDATHPTISYPKWTKQFYGKTWKAEQERLEMARQLDQTAAYQSASWGMFQVMGFNYKACGFKDVDSFVASMRAGELGQLQAFAGFIKTNKLDTVLQKLDFRTLAEKYNGPQYALNKYDTKLMAAYQKAKAAL